MNLYNQRLLCAVENRINSKTAIIKPSQLLDLLHRNSAPLLLDVRTQQEFLVSSLPNAFLYKESLITNSMNQELEYRIKNCEMIVVYCSIGIRSEKVARQLEILYPSIKIRNLYGGIFLWALEQNTITGQHAPLVHPYSEKWAQYLPAEIVYPLAKMQTPALVKLETSIAATRNIEKAGKQYE